MEKKGGGKKGQSGFSQANTKNGNEEDGPARSSRKR